MLANTHYPTFVSVKHKPPIVRTDAVGAFLASLSRVVKRETAEAEAAPSPEPQHERIAA